MGVGGIHSSGWKEYWPPLNINSFPGKGHNKLAHFFDFSRTLNPINLIHKGFFNVLAISKEETEIYNP